MIKERRLVSILIFGNDQDQLFLINNFLDALSIFDMFKVLVICTFCFI